MRGAGGAGISFMGESEIFFERVCALGDSRSESRPPSVSKEHHAEPGSRGLRGRLVSRGEDVRMSLLDVIPGRGLTLFALARECMGRGLGAGANG
jgi:hypothetical protein